MSLWGLELLSSLACHWLWLLPLAVSYVALCSLLRWRRIETMQRKLGFADPRALSSMTTVQAQSIVQHMIQLEFPFTLKTALQFALFKTYGIPTISKVLVDTRMFSEKATASKRYEDTEVLIGEFMAHGPTEERTRQAIGRMNSLHSPFIKAGKISNEDLLYTLALFISEPVRFIEMLEWRHITKMELCALATFWKSIGDAMSIQYIGYLKQNSWKDGLEFAKDIIEWAQQYEEEYMRPAASNCKTANELTPLLLFYLPSPFVGFARSVMGVIMGERLREAMMFESPSASARLVTKVVLGLRRFVLRHLALPRFCPKVSFSERDPATGRYHKKDYLVHPYYVKPTFSNRWGPQAWITRVGGGIVPGGAGGAKYSPEGYRFEEIGPVAKKTFDAEHLKKWENEAEKSLPLGCPFAISR